MKKILLLLLVCASTLPTFAQQLIYAQCGGESWSGTTECVSGAYCSYYNEYYSQCLPGGAAHGIISQKIPVGSSGTSNFKSLETSPMVSQTMTSSTGYLTVNGQKVTTGGSTSSSTTYSTGYVTTQCTFDLFNSCDNAAQKMIISVSW